MTETRASLTFDGIEIAAAKNRLWHVEARGKSAAERFLDQALEKVVPHLTSRQRDAVILKLLVLVHFQQPQDQWAEPHPSEEGAAKPKRPAAMHGEDLLVDKKLRRGLCR
jgi:hypothetical protein